MSLKETPTDPLLEKDITSPEAVVEAPEVITPESAEELKVEPAPVVEPVIEEAETIADTAPEPTPEPEAEPEAVPETKEVKKVVAPSILQKDEIAETKKILTEGPQTQFIVPLGEQEAVGSTEEVAINGYKTIVPKGELVTIPVNVAKIIANKYKIGMTAGKPFKANRNDETSEALS